MPSATQTSQPSVNAWSMPACNDWKAWDQFEPSGLAALELAST